MTLACVVFLSFSDEKTNFATSLLFPHPPAS
jgi:hypothetical protein